MKSRGAATLDREEAEEENPFAAVELPRRKAYDPELFWKIDWKALPADLAFLAFGILFSLDYFEDDAVFREVSPTKLLILYIVVVAAVCWYMGYVLGRFRMYYGKFVRKAAGWVLTIAGLTLLGYMMALVVNIGADAEMQGTDTEHLAMFASFMLVIGPLIGVGGYMTSTQVTTLVMSEEEKKKRKPGDPTADEIFYVCVFTILLAIFCLVWGSMSDFVQESSVSGLWIALVFIGSCFVGALGALFLMGVKKILVAIGLYYRLAFIFETLLPCVVISALIFWNELQHHYLSDLSSAGKIGVLIFTGILPFRLLLVFNPPLRILNLLIGLACFCWYIYSLR